MFEPLHVMIVGLIFAFALMILGYSWRHKKWGIILLTLGIICMFGSIAYRIHIATSL